MQVQLENRYELCISKFPFFLTAGNTSVSRHIILNSGVMLSVPLLHSHSLITVKPMIPNQGYRYSSHALNWDHVFKPGETCHENIICQSNRGTAYR